MSNVHEYFRKNVTCDNIRSRKNPRLYPLSIRYVFEKITREVKRTPSPSPHHHPTAPLHTQIHTHKHTHIHTHTNTQTHTHTHNILGVKVDFQYSEKLYDLYNDLPLLPKTRKTGKVEKVVANLHDERRIGHTYKKLKKSIKSWISIEKSAWKH